MTAGCCTALCPAQAPPARLARPRWILRCCVWKPRPVPHRRRHLRRRLHQLLHPPRQPQPATSVYFDFDSWTLKAEQLKVLDDAINSARNGGQTNITIVGHTDTSGPSDYNQKLSVRRANVVVEALVQMGARRAALHASGVGETDLAVQTEDDVKEAKNRRTVITLQP
jgi:outer membrane protein OmpA-like peptidoglycan-associated protein